MRIQGHEEVELLGCVCARNVDGGDLDAVADLFVRGLLLGFQEFGQRETVKLSVVRILLELSGNRTLPVLQDHDGRETDVLVALDSAEGLFRGAHGGTQIVVEDICHGRFPQNLGETGSLDTQGLALSRLEESPSKHHSPQPQYRRQGQNGVGQLLSDG